MTIIKNKKYRLSILFIMICCVFLFACSTQSTKSNPSPGGSSASQTGDAKPKADGNQLRVGGSTTSTWIYGFVSTWTEVIRAKAPELNMNVQATAGSSAHYLMMEQNQLDLASGFTPSEYYASKGEKNFEKPFTAFRALIPVADSKAHVFTLADSKITSIKDLDGVKLGVGSRGSPTSVVAEALAEALGIKPTFVYSDAGELMDMLRDKRVDAAWYFSGAPWSAVIDLASQTEIKLISFTEDEMSKIQEKSPFITQKTITTNDYSFVKEPVTVPGALQTIIVHKDVPDDVVYKLTKATWENWNEVVKLVPAAGKVSQKDVAHLEGKLHPGALKYYEEKGVEIPAGLKP